MQINKSVIMNELLPNFPLDPCSLRRICMRVLEGDKCKQYNEITNLNYPHLFT